MGGAKEHIEAVFGASGTLYDILGVERGASAAEIRKSYFKLARKYHPDKCPGDEEAHGKFQALSMVHAVLSDAEKRGLYDDTGEIDGDDEGLNDKNFETWYNFYRQLFPRVTAGAIDQFKVEYRFSEEEKKDILAAYRSAAGDVQGILDMVMLAEDEDEPRFRKIIQAAIDAGELKHEKAFDKRRRTKKMKAKGAQEEAAAAADLTAAILNKREKKRGPSALDELMSKYGAPDQAASAAPDIDDAAFEAIQARLNGNKDRSDKAKKSKNKA